MRTDRPELRALTGLRFVAAVQVLLFHAVFTFSRASLLLPRGAARSLLGSGYVGVNFFFVLSGFVLAYAYTDAETGRIRATAARFWRARFARVYPMHLIGVLLALPLFVLGSLDHHAAPSAIAAEGAKEVTLSALLVQAWVPAHALDLNGPAWSLSVEAFFYAVFPWLVRLVARLERRGLVVAAAAAWIAALAPALLHRGPASPVAPTTDLDLVLLHDPLVRLPDFVIGAATGLFYLRGPREWARAPVVGVATILLLLAILAASDRLPFLLLHNGLLDPLWALLVFCLAQRPGEGRETERGIASGPFVRGGHASYSLYVLHKPLYFWAARIFGVGLLPRSAFLGAYVAGAILISLVAAQYVEEPLRRALAGGKTGEK